MARKRYKPEEIVGKLRQAEVLHGQGMSMAGAIRQLGISEMTRLSPRTTAPDAKPWRRSVRPTGKSSCRLWAATIRNVIRQFLTACRAHDLPDTRTISLPHGSIVIPWADYEMFGAKTKAR